MPREREIGQKNAPLFNKRWTSEAEEKDEIKTYVYQQVGRKRERAPQLFSLSWTRIPPGKKTEKNIFGLFFCWDILGAYKITHNSLAVV